MKFIKQKRIYFVALILTLYSTSSLSENDNKNAKSNVKGSTGTYQLTKFSIDNGGKKSESGQFKLTGTIGQHDAHKTIQGQGGQFKLSPGFWSPQRSKDEIIFKDSFEN